MTRRLFTLASLLSLALCLATAVLWVRNYWVSDSYDRDRSGVRISVGSNWGSVWWSRTDYAAGVVDFSHGIGYEQHPAHRYSDVVVAPVWSAGGFAWFHFGFEAVPNTMGMETRDLRVPDWSIVLATLILPTIWVMNRRHARRPPWLCPSCGYNLTGNASGVCPECGTRVTDGVKA